MYVIIWFCPSTDGEECSSWKDSSSLPMSTPPPSALTISSPEFAPLSPVHTNALNDAKSLNIKSDPTNFNLPPSYTEDNRAMNALTYRGITSENSFGDQRNDRFITGGNLYYFANGPTDWNEALEIISFGSPEQSVEGMKVVCHELAQATSDPDGSAMDELVKDADRLVAKTFDFSLTGASSRSCKYVLNTLMQTFQNKRLAHAVNEGTLDSLITELLLWLLDERVPHMDDGSQLLKALNVLMLKILDNADRTSSFVVLINLLSPLDPSRWPSPASNESLASRNQKFSDLVVKCLIKLTKVLQSTIYDVDLDRILQSIHLYLQDLGMEEIRRRAGADDKPLRMVKTVLHELVKLRGAAIKGHLSMVPIDMKPQPIILAYIDLNLEQELAAIFKKIGDKQTCTIGLYELYRITQLYPKVDIFAQLQNASEAFRTYIRDDGEECSSWKDSSSLPMSTPPPSALTISSPEFAPLSPVHTNALNDAKSLNIKSDPTNFNLPPSYTEDNRAMNALTYRGITSENSFGDQRNDRFITGGNLYYL
ncbi:protein mor1 [Quercus suber]|uniref:Protein mor1 n=1 Tax=Quercus suber TaxID=58331 RepID=A0AAW0JQT2_QUESU